jgi:hypothetical protein
MNNEACFIWKNIAYQSRFPLPLIKKGLIGHVMYALALGYEEKEYL